MALIKKTRESKKLGVSTGIKMIDPHTGRTVDAPTFRIERFSDLIRCLRVDDPNGPLRLILDDVDERLDESKAWCGVTDGGFARPLRSGLWFRGQADSRLPLTPSIFRTRLPDGSLSYVDEKNVFNEIRLRLPEIDYNSDSYFSVLCKLRHHSLPCRLLDWTESVLVAVFFAVSSAVRFRKDATLSVLNAYRLNKVSTVFRGDVNIGLAYPHYLDVALRSAMAAHGYIEDAIVQAFSEFSYFTDHKSQQLIEKFSFQHAQPETGVEFREFLKALQMPIAVYPNRITPRMIAQSSVFTLHGGKQIYARDVIDAEGIDRARREFDNVTYKEIEPPIDIDAINIGQFNRAQSSPTEAVVGSERRQSASSNDGASDGEVQIDRQAGQGFADPDQNNLNESDNVPGSRHVTGPFLVHFHINESVCHELLEELRMLGIDESTLFADSDSHISAVTQKWSMEFS